MEPPDGEFPAAMKEETPEFNPADRPVPGGGN